MNPVRNQLNKELYQPVWTGLCEYLGTNVIGNIWDHTVAIMQNPRRVIEQEVVDSAKDIR